MGLSANEVLLMLSLTTTIFCFLYWVYKSYFINNIGIEEHFIRCTLRYATRYSKIATSVDSKNADAWLLVRVALRKVYLEERILPFYELNNRVRQNLIGELHLLKVTDPTYESYVIALKHVEFWYSCVSNIMKGHFLGTSFKVNVYRVYKVLKNYSLNQTIDYCSP